VSVYPPSWIDQFVLRGSGPAEVLTPFRQTLAAASMLTRVAEDRTGLTLREYDVVGSAGYQAVILAEFAQQLDDEVAKLSRDAEHSRISGADPDRTLINSLTGVVRTTATLVEVCHALLRVAESLLVVRRPKQWIELAAAVETLRAAVGTSQITVQTNLSRITDARTYDQLAAGLPTFDRIRAHADRVSEVLRRQTAPLSFPAQRSDLAV
jgi:hypothetical protein